MHNKWKRSLATIASVTAGIVLCSPFAQAAVHTVVPGETLWSISQRYDTSIEKLMSTNNIQDDRLQPGQKLTVPDVVMALSVDPARDPESPAQMSAADGAPVEGQAETKLEQPLVYTVQIGDTLYAIGQQYGVAVEEIMSTNNLTTTLLQLDQELVIPGHFTEAINQDRTSTSRGGDRESNDLIEKAKVFLGAPYRYGGSGPSNFDCSGFTAYVYAQVGRTLPHNAASQSKQGQPVAKSDLIPGDLVFFGYYGSSDIQHVGIYVGGNNFIHASTSGGVKYSSLAQDYYFKNYKGACRL